MIESKTTVLYVDDNPKSRRLLASVLRDCGFDVVTAGNPVEGLKLSKKMSFDLVLLDYQMPVMSGPGLAQKMKATHPGVPVVMISGYAVLPDVELVFVDAHFGRGSALDDLLTTMRTLILSKPMSAEKLVSAHQWTDST